MWRFLCEKLWLNSPPGSESHGSLPICAMPYLWLQNSLEVRGQLLEEMVHQESGPPVSHKGDHCALLGCGFSWVRGDPSLRAWGSIQKHCNKWPHDCCTRIHVCTNQHSPTTLLLGPWVSLLGPQPSHSRGPSTQCLWRNMNVCVTTHSQACGTTGHSWQDWGGPVFWGLWG